MNRGNRGTIRFDIADMSALPNSEFNQSPELALAGQPEPLEQVDTRSPLSEAQFEQLQLIQRLAHPAHRAGGYAKFSGWTTLLAGALSIPFALRNIPMLVFCICLAGIGTRELTLRRQLLHLKASAPKKLAVNQLLLAGTLIAYSVYMLMGAPSTSMVDSALSSDPMLQSTPELSGMIDDLAQLELLAKAAMYAGLIVIAIFVQGGTAVYYITKAKSLQRLHQRCPAWCVRVYQTMHTS
ncbi:MAG: hypothetical protein ACF8MF_09885 [Phycisphaerales bacterium JB052]